MKNPQEWCQELCFDFALSHIDESTVEAIQTDARAELLERLQKAEQQLKEAVSIIKESKGFVIYKVPLQWINRANAFLASQKDAK